MDWLALLLKLVARRAGDGPRRRDDRPLGPARPGSGTDEVERGECCLPSLAGPFERTVRRPARSSYWSAGLLTAWAQGYPWLGLTTGWMLHRSSSSSSAIARLVPTIFIPRGRIFEAALADARAAGVRSQPSCGRPWPTRPCRASPRRYESVALRDHRGAHGPQALLARSARCRGPSTSRCPARPSRGRRRRCRRSARARRM